MSAKASVFFGGQKLRLEPSHLAGRGSLSFDRPATDNPPHGGIASQTIGIVDIIISAEPAKHRLTELPRHAMPPVLAGTTVLEKTAANLGQAKGIVKLPVGEQSSV